MPRAAGKMIEIIYKVFLVCFVFLGGILGTGSCYEGQWTDPAAAQKELFEGKIEPVPVEKS